MEWTSRIRSAFEGRQLPDEDIIEELAQHAAAAYQAARAEGHGHREADRAVSAQIGEWARDDQYLTRRPRRRPAVVAPPPGPVSRSAGMAQDIRYAWHLLRRQWGHALVVVLTMGLGIGAATSLFSVAYGVLLKPMPWPDADRLVRVTETRQGSTRPAVFFTNSTYLAWQERPTTIDGLGAYASYTATLTGAGDPARIQVGDASPSLFPLLGARPALGTPFAVAASGQADESQALISHGLWMRRFDSSRQVLGRVIRIDGSQYRIVGVMPAGFGFPTPTTDVWLPFNVRPAVKPGQQGGMLSMFSAIARLRPGVTVAQAQAEATAQGRSAPDAGMVVMAVFGSRGPVQVSVVPLVESIVGKVRPALVVFLVAVGLLLITATANVASLQLARATARRREIAIRCALGAGTPRLTRQLLVENVMLGLAGGGAGLALALGLVRLLPSLLPADFPRVQDIALDYRAALFSVGLSIATGLVFGLVPSLQARRLDVSGALSDDGRSPSGSGSRASTARARLLIMTGQVAVACVLLVGASELTRSFLGLLRADRGHDTANVLTARISLPEGDYDGPRRTALLERTLARLKQLPGVTHAAYSSRLPLGHVMQGSGGSGSTGEILGAFPVPARSGSGTTTAHAGIRQVSPEYFAALGIRVVEGRGFTAADTANSKPAVLVNRVFAKRYLDRAVGTDLPGSPSPREVVGVVDDIKYGAVTDATQPELYTCATQLPKGYQGWEPFILVRTSGDPSRIAQRLREIVREQDPSVPLESVMTMEARVWTSLAQPRLYALLLGVFAAFALAIAAVGLFGVLSYSVLQRSREIGIRTTLGATPAGIAKLVVGQAVLVTAVGLLAGLGLAAGLGRYMSHLLYGIRPFDAVSYLAGPAVLMVAAVLACVVPARRAATIDPVDALR